MTTNSSSQFLEIVETLRNGERFVLSSHARPDGDSIGSQLALAHSLSRLGKIVRIINHDPPPTYLDTLPGVSNIEVLPAVMGAYDAAIVLECGSLDRTEVFGLENYRVINIDHHTGNNMYGSLNWFDPSAAACAEMIYDVVVELGMNMTPAIGIPLYAGILTDTGSFRHANITNRTFNICRDIASTGVNVANIASDIFQRSSVGKIKLMGTLLENMRLEAGGQIALLHLDEHILTTTGCPADDMEGIINIPLSAHTIVAVILFKIGNGSTRVSLRSKGTVNVQTVAAMFGGGGHPNASGFAFSEPYKVIAPGILEAVTKAIKDTTTNDPNST